MTQTSPCRSIYYPHSYSVGGISEDTKIALCCVRGVRSRNLRNHSISDPIFSYYITTAGCLIFVLMKKFSKASFAEWLPFNLTPFKIGLPTFSSVLGVCLSPSVDHEYLLYLPLFVVNAILFAMTLFKYRQHLHLMRTVDLLSRLYRDALIFNALIGLGMITTILQCIVSRVRRLLFRSILIYD